MSDRHLNFRLLLWLALGFFVNPSVTICLAESGNHGAGFSLEDEETNPPKKIEDRISALLETSDFADRDQLLQALQGGINKMDSVQMALLERYLNSEEAAQADPEIRNFIDAISNQAQAKSRAAGVGQTTIPPAEPTLTPEAQSQLGNLATAVNKQPAFAEPAASPLVVNDTAIGDSLATAKVTTPVLPAATPINPVSAYKADVKTTPPPSTTEDSTQSLNTWATVSFPSLLTFTNDAPEPASSGDMGRMLEIVSTDPSPP